VGGEKRVGERRSADYLVGVNASLCSHLGENADLLVQLAQDLIRLIPQVPTD